MPVSELSGSEREVRAGAQALSLLSAPRNSLILRGLTDGPKRQVELRRASGFPAQTTLRGHLKNLEQAGLLAKHVRDPFPAMLEYQLTGAGRDLLAVIDAVERWLEGAPDGPFALGSEPSKTSIKALVDGWGSTILHVLATGPHSLTQLDTTIRNLNYPSIERRLATMRLAGQIEARPGEGKGIHNEVTGWARRGIAPLVSAARWEAMHMSAEGAPVTRLDVETAFLLVSPLLQLAPGTSGSCAMTVKLPRGQDGGPVGVEMQVTEGVVSSCTTTPSDDCDSGASGPAGAWFLHIIEGDSSGLSIDGGDLVKALLDGLHETLFPG